MNSDELNNNLDQEQQSIDDGKLARIIKKIIELENENVKTKELSEEQIKKKIASIIEEEVKCC